MLKKATQLQVYLAKSLKYRLKTLDKSVELRYTVVKLVRKVTDESKNSNHLHRKYEAFSWHPAHKAVGILRDCSVRDNRTLPFWHL